MTAKPKPGTKLMTAICLNCDGVLYKKPRQPWIHDYNGQRKCEPDEVD